MIDAAETRLIWMLSFSADPVKFRDDLFNIARTTLSSKVLSQDKDYFANLAVDAVLRLQVCLFTSHRFLFSLNSLFLGIYRSGPHPDNQESWRKAHRFVSGRRCVHGDVTLGVLGILHPVSHLWDVGFILDKQMGTNSPKRLEDVKILIANTCETSI